MERMECGILEPEIVKQPQPHPISMRKTALKHYGGKLDNLYDVKRFENPHATSKPRRSWKEYRRHQWRAS